MTLSQVTTNVDAEGTTARGCPHHSFTALSGLTDAHADWADSKAHNEWERQALELAKERSKFSSFR
jgi:hypothetical protein